MRNTIKNHFGLTNDSLKSYEKILNGYRKEPNDSEERKPLSKDEYIKILHEEETKTTVHPAQDYGSGVMNFVVKIREALCLVTSTRKIFDLEQAPLEGFVLKHETVDTTRFSPKGVISFLEGKEIDIPEIFQRIYDYIKRFIHFPEEAYLTYLALWIMGSYVFMLFRYFPYVWLNAEKGSGKTLLMEILSAIAFNGDLITNPTEAVIYRDISNNLITMFIDEVEQLRKRDKDVYSSLISVLNAGFNKSGMVKRTECTPDGYVIKAYSAYSPKMFAGISEIDDVLQDRTVRVSILRKKDDEYVKRYKTNAEVLELQRSIRDDLYVFALTYAKDIAGLYESEDENGIEGLAHLTNRELDIWEPIFLLANIVDAKRGSTEVTGVMEALSKKSFEEKQADSVSQNETYKLLNVLKAMLEETVPLSKDRDLCLYETSAMLDYFKKTEEFEWLEKSNALTRRLKRVKIKSTQRRFDGDKKQVYIINVADLTDLCERFKI